MGVDTIGEVGGLSDNCAQSARKIFTLLIVNQRFAAMIPLFWYIFVFGYDNHNVLSIDDKQNSYTCIIITQKVGGLKPPAVYTLALSLSLPPPSLLQWPVH